MGPGSSVMKAKVASGTYGKWSGLKEYELTLQVAKQLRDELQTRGYQVYMIRDSHDVGGGAGTHVNGRHFGSRGIIDGDGYTLQISEIELQGIAHNLLAGRDDGLVAVAELEVLCRLGIDGEGILGMCDLDGADFHGLHRIDVAQLEANHVASYANLYHLAYRTVSHAIVIGHK